MKLRVDFVRPRPVPSPLGWGLLVLGLLALAWAGWRYQSVSAAHEAATARLAALSPKSAPRRPAARPAAQDEAEALAGRRLLEADWGGLLAALEQSRPADVALLRVEAEAARGTLLLSATAKDAAAMLAYLQRLERLPLLSRVALSSHQDEAVDGLRTVRFDLRAQWGGAAP
jgi:hypothetical protein